MHVNGTINTNSAAGNLTLPLGASVPPTPTTNMSLALNLNSTAAVGATVTAPVQVYDSLGVSHDLTVTYTNTAPNTWSYAVTVPSADLAGNPAAPPPLASGNLTFDSSGNLLTPAAAAGTQTIPIAGLADGAANMSISWDLYNTSGATPVPTITQYDAASSINGTTQNGFAAGSVSGVALQSGGTVMATYTNGQQVAVGQLALASITNPSSLSSVGNNNLADTANTAIPVVGAANTGGRGQIVAGALESSTVDIATEFANLLTFERGYQADSLIITTSDQLQQETISLIPQQ